MAVWHLCLGGEILLVVLGCRGAVEEEDIMGRRGKMGLVGDMEGGGEGREEGMLVVRGVVGDWGRVCPVGSGGEGRGYQTTGAMEGMGGAGEEGIKFGRGLVKECPMDLARYLTACDHGARLDSNHHF